jgi:4-hydroxyphenylpyruvate dioxygenase-like putative hemolysin
MRSSRQRRLDSAGNRSEIRTSTFAFRQAPANTLGIRHIAFAVEDIDTVVAHLRARGRS